MQIDKKAIQDRLRKSDFTGVFTQELGWDFPPGNLDVTVSGKEIHLQAVAEKRGLVAFVCTARPDDRLPDHATRRKIEREVAKHLHQHLIIFTDADKTTQVWQWVKRDLGKPAACREHTYHAAQPGDALIQKLTALAVSLSEEESLTHADVTGRVKKAFDVEKVTKKFYDRFQKEHDAFLKLLKGIPDEDMERWYVSVMLNRLMFIYFIQSKGFLGGGDCDYLRTKLAESKGRGKDRYYREFLCPLFFDGFAERQEARSDAMNKLLGTVPYLNGGLFLKHQIEALHGEEIRIPDAAFDKLFEFFHGYHWHLDERPLKADNEINPDVLGYIFEKYINQKQMGAYYTKEDITEYIAKNTIIPFLFDATAKKCPNDFAADAPLWRLLAEDPDRYIYAAVRRGVVDEKGNVLSESALPDFVRAGMHDPAARMYERRYNLGEADLRSAAGEKLTLPTETWREYVARRQRCLDLREKIAKGEVRSINDLITFNLDIRQFAQDVIAESQSPELLAAFFESICTMTVLDPTCGSGAFLFAALNILEPLYEACLDRMESLVTAANLPSPSGRAAGGEGRRPSAKIKQLDDFRQTLKSVNDDHPNAKYFIFKSIIIRNLFGVDIMEEAVEICKLRLFLKLVAQVDPDPSKPNLGVEPLPDIDFNIRAGNTLVGYTTMEEIRRSQSGKLAFNSAEIARIETQAQAVANNFDKFRKLQTGKENSDYTSKELAAAKQTLTKIQADLGEELNRYLAGDYGIDAADSKAAKKYQEWKKSHQPFHWLAEFFGIMRRGGFDAIIGNPPYLEASKLGGRYSIKGYATERCRDIYAWVVERVIALPCKVGRVGLIVPVSIVSSGSFDILRTTLEVSPSALWFSHFANRPGQLFVGAQNRLTIFLRAGAEQQSVQSTKYHRWDAKHGQREFLFQVLQYTHLGNLARAFHGLYPKVGCREAASVIASLAGRHTVSDLLERSSEFAVYWVRVPGYFCQFFLKPPMAKPENGGPRRPRGEVNAVNFREESIQRALHAVLNSSTYLQFYCAYTDGRHVNPSDVKDFHFDFTKMSQSTRTSLVRLSKRLEQAMRENVSYWRKSGLLIESVDSRPTKPILDEIDQVLAEHYGFTSAELDYVANHDIKYRMGQDEGGEDE